MKTGFGKLLRYAKLVCLMFGLAYPVTGHAEDESQERFRFYGHFSPTILMVGDGVDTYVNATDNSSSGGRIGLWFTNPIDDVTLSANVEFSLGVRLSAGINQLYTPPLFELGSQTLRKGEIILETARFGKFSIGQGSMGSDGAAETDLSGTGMAGYVGISDMAGGFLFRTAAGSLSSVSIKDAFPTYDGGRSQRLRWDSPEIKFGVLGSLRFVGSIGREDIDRNVTLNDALQDMGLFYRNSVGQFAFAGSGGVSIVEDRFGSSVPQVAGSLSILHHPTGMNATFATGARDSGGEYGYLKLGVKRDFFGIGHSAFSVDLYRSYDTVKAGSVAESIGFGLVQTVNRWNTDFFIGVRTHRYRDSRTVRFQDINSVMFGVRWQFRRLEQHRSVFEGLWDS